MGVSRTEGGGMSGLQYHVDTTPAPRPPLMAAGNWGHTQAPVVDSNGEMVFEVDEALVPLLQRFFDGGIQTHNSCALNQGKHVWIEFALQDWQWLVERNWDGNKELVRWIDENGDLKFTQFDWGHENADGTDWVEGIEMGFGVSLRFAPSLLEEFTTLIKEVL